MNVGGNVLKKLTAVENSMRAIEATSDAGDGPTFGQVCTVILDEIIPVMTNLWDLYMLATEGPGKVLRPGPGKPPGKYLWTQLLAGPLQSTAVGDAGLTFEQCIVWLEETLVQN
jgi:hypothetical protein